MNSEEKKRGPDAQDDGGLGSEESPEPVDEAQGSPGDPASLGQPAEDPGTVEDSPGPEVLADEEPDLAEDELAAVSAELENTRQERDEYLDALRRLKAEFENARKRQQRERDRILQTASERLVLELLPVLDNLDRALEAGGDIREGVRVTRDQLADVLGKEGLLPVASDGQTFDPNVHEAVMGQASEEHEEGTILQTFERGYLLRGKPIRPAKVVVARQV
ncbi:MAG: nucleotide exchange factor GrpE [Actinomycetota bacterium]|nr:nucleotide exchange factor GrpE [Actinomycetota bacterium]